MTFFDFLSIIGASLFLKNPTVLLLTWAWLTKKFIEKDRRAEA